jgi:hypothetical protein
MCSHVFRIPPFVRRVGVVALEQGTQVLVTLDPNRRERGLPGIPIENEHMTRNECFRALAPFVRVHLTSDVRLDRVTEFDGEWGGIQSRIIVYVLKKAMTHASPSNESAFVDLSKPLTFDAGPTLSHLMAARSHAVSSPGPLQVPALATA